MEQILSNQPLILLIVAWSMFWKGLALWQAARGIQKYWFIAILIINSVGLLDIIFLIWFAKKKISWKKTFTIKA
jgi:hypothetical protein